MNCQRVGLMENRIQFVREKTAYTTEECSVGAVGKPWLVAMVRSMPFNHRRH
jgi:hypothetical protein